MSNRIKKQIGSLVLIIGIFNINVCGGITIGELQKKLASLAAYSYKYTITRKFPDGNTYTEKGTISYSKDYIFERSGLGITIQTKDWYYQANFDNKVVCVTNVSGSYRTAQKKGMLKPMSLVPDSILEKHGKVTLTTEGNLVKAKALLESPVPYSSIYIEYDLAKQAPRLYKVVSKSYYDTDLSSNAALYYDQVFIASDFSVRKQKIEDLKNYFEIKKGKVVLKKYTNYQLIQHI